MSDEFKRRLDAAASRAQAKQAQSEANADNPITEIKATVAEWKARIRPAIGRAVEEANKRTPLLLKSHCVPKNRRGNTSRQSAVPLTFRAPA